MRLKCKQAADTRSMVLPATYGDSADEIEQAALARAQEGFGPGVQLELARDYELRENFAKSFSGKKFYANDLTVRVAGR